MSVDPALSKFLGRWLMSRMSDKSVSKTVLALQGGLNTMAVADVLTSFRDSLLGRIARLPPLVLVVEQHDDPTSIVINPALTRWLRLAHELLEQWDESRWCEAALELSGEKNPLMLHAITQSLEESVTKAVQPEVARPWSTSKSSACLTNASLPPSPFHRGRMPHGTRRIM